MTRTARRGKKKDPLPATPWEELSGGQTHLDHSGNGNTTGEVGQGEGQGVDLKLTRKKKLGSSLSRKAKTKLKRLTARQVLNRTPSDSVILLESSQSTSQESLNGSLTDSQLVQSAELVNTKNKQVPLRNRGTSSGATVKIGGKGKLDLKSRRGKKKKRLSGDNVCLLRQSDSESSLSDQVEEAGSGGGESECESGDNGEPGDDETAVEYTEEEEVSNCQVKNKIKSKRKLGRVKVGKKWVKASSNKPQPPVEQDGGDSARETGQGDGIGKRRRPMDEESRRKRIEHRKLRRQRKKVGHL